MQDPESDSDLAPLAGGQPAFVTTRWTVVVSAGAGGSPEAARALEDLCRAYWYPLYAHVRRLGRSPADAEDLTQAFFGRLLEKQWLAAADPARGRFRTFLLGALNHFLANEWDRVRALKRGGHLRFVPLDVDEAESRLEAEAGSVDAPDRAFDRRWALALLNEVLARLEQEYAADGKSALFARLKEALEVPRLEASYGVLARDLGMREGAVRVAVHRLRQRYRQLLRDEIAQTVANPAEVEAELQHLFVALGG